MLDFIKYFVRYSRAKTIVVMFILFVMIDNFARGGFDVKSVYGITMGLLSIWGMFRVNARGNLFIAGVALILLVVILLAGFEIRDTYRSYYAGFLLGSLSMLLFKEYTTFQHNN